MKHTQFFLFVTFMISLSVFAAEMPSETVNPQLASSSEPLEPFEEDRLIFDLSGKPQILAGIADSDRGCCVLLGEKTNCVYTNRKHCEVMADSSGVSHVFHQGTSCRTISECPAK